MLFGTFRWDMAEPTDTVLAASSIVVAAGLVVVTYYLVRHTQNLARATEGLRQIEERRERGESRRRQLLRLKRKIELVQHLLGWNLETWKHNYLVKGAMPRPEADEIKELATLLDYGKDHSNCELIEGLVRVLDLLAQGVRIEGVPADNFVDNLSHLAKLREDIPRWEADLIALSTEETAAIVEDLRVTT